MRPMIARALAALAVLAAQTNFAHRAEASDGQQPVTNHDFRPLTLAEFEQLKASVLFTEQDVRYLRMSRAVLEPQVDALLDVWYGFVGSQPHLLASFSHPTTGKPDGEYLAKVRVRFRAWVLETADAKFDQAWLNRQLELGLRHHRLKKNQTDGVTASDHIPLRHLVALSYPIGVTIRPFLETSGHSAEDVQGMHEAWRKITLLTSILWSQPYVPPQDY